MIGLRVDTIEWKMYCVREIPVSGFFHNLYMDALAFQALRHRDADVTAQLVLSQLKDEHPDLILNTNQEAHYCIAGRTIEIWETEL